MPTQQPTVPMPPYPWEDARFAEPPGLTADEFIGWAVSTYAEYPAFLRRLLEGGIAMGSPYSLDLAVRLRALP